MEPLLENGMRTTNGYAVSEQARAAGSAVLYGPPLVIKLGASKTIGSL